MKAYHPEFGYHDIPSSEMEEAKKIGWKEVPAKEPVKPKTEDKRGNRPNNH